MVSGNGTLMYASDDSQFRLAELHSTVIQDVEAAAASSGNSSTRNGTAGGLPVATSTAPVSNLPAGNTTPGAPATNATAGLVSITGSAGTATTPGSSTSPTATGAANSTTTPVPVPTAASAAPITTQPVTPPPANSTEQGGTPSGPIVTPAQLFNNVLQYVLGRKGAIGGSLPGTAGTAGSTADTAGIAPSDGTATNASALFSGASTDIAAYDQASPKQTTSTTNTAPLVAILDPFAVNASTATDASSYIQDPAFSAILSRPDVTSDLAPPTLTADQSISAPTSGDAGVNLTTLSAALSNATSLSSLNGTGALGPLVAGTNTTVSTGQQQQVPAQPINATTQVNQGTQGAAAAPTAPTQPTDGAAPVAPEASGPMAGAPSQLATENRTQPGPNATVVGGQAVPATTASPATAATASPDTAGPATAAGPEVAPEGNSSTPAVPHTAQGLDVAEQIAAARGSSVALLPGSNSTTAVAAPAVAWGNGTLQPSAQTAGADKAVSAFSAPATNSSSPSSAPAAATEPAAGDQNNGAPASTAASATEPKVQAMEGPADSTPTPAAAKAIPVDPAFGGSSLPIGQSTDGATSSGSSDGVSASVPAWTNAQPLVPVSVAMLPRLNTSQVVLLQLAVQPPTGFLLAPSNTTLSNLTIANLTSATSTNQTAAPNGTVPAAVPAASNATRLPFCAPCSDTPPTTNEQATLTCEDVVDWQMVRDPLSCY